MSHYQTTNETLYQTYKLILEEILQSDYQNTYSKGSARELVGVHLEIGLISDFPLLPNNRRMPRKKLLGELLLYLDGQEDIREYQNKNITWWGYASIGGKLKNTYPKYFKEVRNLKKSPTRNNVISLWENRFLRDKKVTSQTPCLSQLNVQHVSKDNFILLVTQRSADANLGVPSDFYQIGLLVQKLQFQWDKKCSKIVWDFNNIHIYENNVKETLKWLDNWDIPDQKYNFILNV